MRKKFLFFYSIFFFFTISGCYRYEIIFKSDTPEEKNKIDENQALEEFPEISFSHSELRQIAYLIDILPENTKKDFYANYVEWVESWGELSAFSQSRTRIEAIGYDPLLKFCKQYDRALLPLIFRKIAEGDHFASNLLIDLTFPEYEDLWEEMRVYSITHYSSLSFYISFSKIILEKEYDTIFQSIQKKFYPEE